VPLRSSLRQGGQKIRGRHRESLPKREKKNDVHWMAFSGAHKQVLTVEKDMHLTSHSSTT